jgi:hypothetical protein
MLEDAAEGVDEGVAVHLGRARRGAGGWVAAQCSAISSGVANQTPSWARM